MSEFGGENTLIKIAIFCIGVSIISTCLFNMYTFNTPDYDYDTINAYRSELTEFSGGQLTNDNPWVLKNVYTPFTPGTIDDADIPDHIEDDNGQSIGWLFGEDISYYPYIGEVTGIKLNPGYKSNQLLSIGSDPVSYEYQNGKAWWNGGNEYNIKIADSRVVKDMASWFGYDLGENYGYNVVSGVAQNWAYSGFRYCFDPVLPFSSDSSTKDGRLSLVWYETDEDSGLSGALEIYAASKSNNQVKLGSISASDIVNTFRTSTGYAQVFDFNFEGTHLNLTIQVDPTVYETYSNLQAAWDAGAWSMAVSSASAGNFFDVDNSNAFTNTAGSMLDTFIDIYTFQYTHFNSNGWAELVMWLLVGLPMTLALLFITMRMVGGVFKIF